MGILLVPFSSLSRPFLVLHWHRLPRVSDAATMISLELWRARIGTFNYKRCSGAGCALSSLSSTSLASSSSSANCRQNLSQEEPASSSLAQTSSSCSFFLVTPDEQLTTGRHLDHHAVSSSSDFLFSSTSSSSSQDTFSSRTSSSSFWSISSYFFPCDQFFLHRSLFREAVITLLIAIISQLLMIAGDIETNPGPKHGGENA